MKTLLSLFTLLLLPCASFAEVTTQSVTFHSKALDKQTTYIATLPSPLEPGVKYPVLYLLDGDAHFHSVTGLLQILGTGINGTFVLPEMIVVAIPNTNRTRDMTPTHTDRDPEGKPQPALAGSGSRHTTLTNVFTGRPARGIVNRIIREIGPLSGLTPQFPLATAAIVPLRNAAEAAGSSDFSPLWSGQNTSGCSDVPAAALTVELVRGVTP